MTDREKLTAAIARHNPHKVIAFRGDDVLREIPVPNTRKNKAAVCDVIAKLAWTKAELVDRNGGLLDVIEATAPATEEIDEGAGVELSDRDLRLLNLILKAQQSALSQRERDERAAMEACTGAVKMLTEAVGALAGLQRKQLEAQSEAYQMQIRAAIEAAQSEGAAGPPEKEGLISEQLLKQMLPAILAKLMAPASAAPAAAATGGK